MIGLEKEPVHPVAAQQPAPGRDVPIGFVQLSQAVGDPYHQGMPPMPLSEPCSVISVGTPVIQQQKEIQKMVIVAEKLESKEFGGIC